MNPLIVILLAFGLSLGAVLALSPVCHRLDHVDRPGGRKRHALATPLSGGLAIALSTVALGLGAVPSRQFSGFAFGLIVLLVLGAMDDRRHVPAVVRLALQAVAVIVGMYGLGSVRLENLGALTGGMDVHLGGYALAFTVFAAVGVINAVNMIDGVDGLAGGFAVMVLSVIFTLATGSDAINMALLYIIFGSVLGFLTFNMRTPWQRQARIFLGDAGSLVLGYTLVWFAIQSSQGRSAVIDPITAVWLFGLPLADTGYLMVTRMLRGKSPLCADRYHFHHLLQRGARLSPGWTLYAWLATAASFMTLGVAAQFAHVPAVYSFAGFLVAFGGYCLVVNCGWRHLRCREARRRVPARS